MRHRALESEKRGTRSHVSARSYRHRSHLVARARRRAGDAARRVHSCRRRHSRRSSGQFRSDSAASTSRVVHESLSVHRRASEGPQHLMVRRSVNFEDDPNWLPLSKMPTLHHRHERRGRLRACRASGRTVTRSRHFPTRDRALPTRASCRRLSHRSGR